MEEPKSHDPNSLSSAPSDHFPYQPLSETASTIRVLWLHPKDEAQKHDDLHIDLEEIPLQEPPEFYAISYTWDGQKPTVPIRCGDREMLVTANCFQILCQLRAETAFRIWIDAICIDQSSIFERNSQVAMMADIYQKAAGVWIWLGELEQDCHDFLLKLTEPTWEQDVDRNPEEGRHPAQIIRSLAGRPWFSRVWTLQEYILPPSDNSICILLGSSKFLFNPLLIRVFDVLGPIKYHPFVQPLLSIFALRTQFVQRRAGNNDMEEEMLVDEVFSAASRRACFNPKDRIFGMHGLLSMLDPAFPTPDYSKNVVDIYADAVKWMLVRSGDNLDLLYSAFSVDLLRNKSELGSDADNLPSWVPDFTIDPVVDPSWGTRNHLTPPLSPPEAVSKFEVLPRRRLRVSGRFVTTISSYHKPHVPQGDEQYVSKSTDLLLAMIDWFAAFQKVRQPEMIQTFLEECISQWSAYDDASAAWFEHVMELARDKPDPSVRVARPLDELQIRSWLIRVADLSNRLLGGASEQESLPDSVLSAWKDIIMQDLFRHWGGCITSSGQIGFGQGDIQSGDAVFVVAGLMYPLVLRRARATVTEDEWTRGSEDWKLIGRALVENISEGWGPSNPYRHEAVLC
ncbi:heterokaryon incompatibility protein-domain-containing protein [Echria macrotheca]|uniref:Heterokaryon incompatibility protein-domain-containing protein n=1 Tax=Echria macrotheca TaxID=438768 RepID=A0AAJ0BNK7_9PEZI|nr:heterokaryon incompatibility protein-domain-containing protein [Echria macrotheca]